MQIIVKILSIFVYLLFYIYLYIAIIVLYKLVNLFSIQEEVNKS